MAETTLYPGDGPLKDAAGADNFWTLSDLKYVMSGLTASMTPEEQASITFRMTGKLSVNRELTQQEIADKFKARLNALFTASANAEIPQAAIEGLLTEMNDISKWYEPVDAPLDSVETWSSIQAKANALINITRNAMPNSVRVYGNQGATVTYTAHSMSAVDARAWFENAVAQLSAVRGPLDPAAAAALAAALK